MIACHSVKFIPISNSLKWLMFNKRIVLKNMTIASVIYLVGITKLCNDLQQYYCHRIFTQYSYSNDCSHSINFIRFLKILQNQWLTFSKRVVSWKHFNTIWVMVYPVGVTTNVTVWAKTSLVYTSDFTKLRPHKNS